MKKLTAVLQGLCPPFVMACCAFLLLTHCAPEKKQDTWDLFSAEYKHGWNEAAMPETGGLTEHLDGLTMKAGGPMTGMVFKDWVKHGLPLMNYSVEYDAMRVEGDDFFGTVTFPVGSVDQCVSFVLGGWGGSQVGISSVDGHDAANNETGSSQPFNSGEWYRIRVEVREGLIQIWMNNAPLVHLLTKDRILGLRAGDIEACVPFGFASYGTEGRIRNCIVRALPPEVSGW